MRKQCRFFKFTVTDLNNRNVLKRTGSDLLSHALRHSTIDAKRFHGPVRNGKGCFTLAEPPAHSNTFKQDISYQKSNHMNDYISKVIKTETSFQIAFKFRSGLTTARNISCQRKLPHNFLKSKILA